LGYGEIWVFSEIITHFWLVGARLFFAAPPHFWLVGAKNVANNAKVAILGKMATFVFLSLVS
jgi:hypothetical protein